MAGPVEKKVQASTTAAAAAGLVLWIIGRYVFRSGVPDVVVSWTYVIVPGVLTFGAGYLARHTNRAPAPPLVARPFPAEKTLMPPAAAAVTEPPAAAGPQGA